MVDPLFIGLPLSILTAVIVSAVTKKSDNAHLAKCFSDSPKAANKS